MSCTPRRCWFRPRWSAARRDRARRRSLDPPRNPDPTRCRVPPADGRASGTRSRRDHHADRRGPGRVGAARPRAGDRDRSGDDPGAGPPATSRSGRPTATPADGYLLTVATLEPRKGLDLLLATLARPEAPELPLVVVGRAGWGGVDPAALAADEGFPPAGSGCWARSRTRISRPATAATAVVVPPRPRDLACRCSRRCHSAHPSSRRTSRRWSRWRGGGSPLTQMGAPTALVADPRPRVVANTAFRGVASRTPASCAALYYSGSPRRAPVTR